MNKAQRCIDCFNPYWKDDTVGWCPIVEDFVEFDTAEPCDFWQEIPDTSTRMAIAHMVNERVAIIKGETFRRV